MTFTLDDGGGTANGGHNTDYFNATVNVGAVNTAPALDLNGQASGSNVTLQYVETLPATSIAPSATLADSTSPNLNGGSLTVALAANGTSNDHLTISNQGIGPGQIGISGNTVSYSGVVIGTFSGGANGVPLIVNFTSDSATPAVVQMLIRDVQFSNLSVDLQAPPRTVTFTVVDGDGVADGGHDTASVTATVNVNVYPQVALTINSDSFSGDNAHPTLITANSATLTSGDTLTGGGHDQLALFGGGNVDLNSIAGYSGIERVNLVNFGSSSAYLQLRDGSITGVVTALGSTPASLAVAVGATIGSIEGNWSNLYLTNAMVGNINLVSAGSIYLSGNTSVGAINGNWSSVRLSGSSTVTGNFEGTGGGNWVSVITAASWNPNIVFNGGDGNDTLRLLDEIPFFGGSSNTTLDLRSATLTSVENLILSGENNSYLVTSGTLADVTTIGNGVSGVGRMVVADATLDLTGITVNNVTVQSSNATGTTFTVDNRTTAFQIYGGDGQDTLQATNLAFTSTERDALFATSSIETIIDQSGTYTAPVNPNVHRMTPGTDTLTLTGADETINANAVTLNASDSLNAGGGVDTLALYGASSFDLNSIAGYSGIERVNLVNFGSSSAYLQLRDGSITGVVTALGSTPASLAVAVGATIGSIEGNWSNLYLTNAMVGNINLVSAGSIYLSGNTSVGAINGNWSSVRLSGSSTVTGNFEGTGGGNWVSVITAASWNPNIVFNGGDGNDTLRLLDEIPFFGGSSNTTLDLRSATLTSVENLILSGENNSYLVTSGTLADVTTIGNGVSGVGRMVVADATLDLTGITVNNVTVQSSNATGTTFTVDNRTTAFQIYGGDGQDTLQATNLAFTSTERDALFATSSIETIIDQSGTYTAPVNPNVHRMTPGTDTLTLTGADETINANAVTLNASDSLNAGGGVDTLALYGASSFDLNSIAGYSGIERVNLVNFGSSSAYLQLRDGSITGVVTALGSTPASLAVAVGATIGSIEGNWSNLYLTNAMVGNINLVSAGSIYLSGNTSVGAINGNWSSVRLSGSSTVTGNFEGTGGGNWVSVITAASWNPNIVFNGGDGDDTLRLLDEIPFFGGSSNTTLDLRSATLTSVENLILSGENNSYLVTSGTLADVTTIGNGVSGVGRMVVADATLDLTGITVNNVTVQSSNATGTTFTVDNRTTAFQIYGGDGQDTLQATNLAFTSTERDAIFGASSVEIIVDKSGTYHSANYLPPNQAANFTGDSGPVILSNNLQTFGDGVGGATVRQLSIADGQTDGLTVSVAAAHGTLDFASSTSGLDNLDADGSDGTLSGTGSLASINQMLADGLVYTPDQDVPPTDMVTLTINDGDGQDTLNFIFNVTGTNPTLSSTAGNDISMPPAAMISLCSRPPAVDTTRFSISIAKGRTTSGSAMKRSLRAAPMTSRTGSRATPPPSMAMC